MTLAMLGDVQFSVVESEEPTYTSQVAQNPVESGVDVVDHVKPESVKFNISGVITGSDAEQKRTMLVNYRDNAALLNYVGRNVFGNMVINSLVPTKNKDITNGFSFTIGLTQIRIAKQETVQLVGTNLQPVVKSHKNKGKQAKQPQIMNVQKQTELLGLAVSKTGS